MRRATLTCRWSPSPCSDKRSYLGVECSHVRNFTCGEGGRGFGSRSLGARRAAAAPTRRGGGDRDRQRAGGVPSRAGRIVGGVEGLVGHRSRRRRRHRHRRRHWPPPPRGRRCGGGCSGGGGGGLLFRRREHRRRRDARHVSTRDLGLDRSRRRRPPLRFARGGGAALLGGDRCFVDHQLVEVENVVGAGRLRIGRGASGASDGRCVL